MSDQTAIDGLVGKLNWLGHDGFRLDGPEGPIYFDPYEIGGQDEARLILITHDHFDHCSVDDVAKITGPNTTIVTEPQAAAKLSGDVRTMAPGDTLEVGGVSIKAVPSYNTDKEFHPQTNQWLGFIITVDGVTLYHAGDTDFIPEMEGMGVDVALLPVSGTYVMTAEQAVQAALAIKPKLAIPMHFGAIVGDDSNAQSFAEALEGKVPVKILPKEG